MLFYTDSNMTEPVKKQANVFMVAENMVTESSKLKLLMLDEDNSYFSICKCKSSKNPSQT